MSAGRSQLDEMVDWAMVCLVRVVVRDDWTAASAAEQLRGEVPAEGVLRCAQVRVARARAESDSSIGARAAATLEAALDGGPRRARPDGGDGLAGLRLEHTGGG